MSSVTFAVFAVGVGVGVEVAFEDEAGLTVCFGVGIEAKVQPIEVLFVDEEFQMTSV